MNTSDSTMAQGVRNISHLSSPGFSYNLINPHTISFTAITNLVDDLRSNSFVPFLFEMSGLQPSLSSLERNRLASIAAQVSRYDRTPALDQRGEWPFTAIAGPNEVWAFELLCAINGGQVYCGYYEISKSVSSDVTFLVGLQCRSAHL